MTTKQTPEGAVAASSPERFDPADDAATLTAAEHYLRYAWAAALAAGKAVLDAGCGTGYGSQLLQAAGAERVAAVDVAPDALAASVDDSIEFTAADIHALPYGDDEFDVVVCFEVIEHVEGRDQVVAELARVLRDDGLLLLSSPNRDAYPAGNPHHVYEYLPEELASEVGARFAKTALYRQDAWLASSIASRADDRDRDPAAARRVAVHELQRARDEHEPYAIVVATNGELPEVPERVMLGNAFEVRWWHDRLAELEAEAERRRGELARVHASAERELSEVRRRASESAAAVLELEAQRAKELEALRHAEREVDDLREAHHEAHQVIQAIQRTRVWRLASLYWQLRDTLLRRRP